MIFAIFGLVLLGFALLSVPTQDPWLILGQAVPGVALLIYAGLTSYADLRDRLGGQAGQRNLWFGSNVVGQGVALAAIIGVIAFVSQKYSVHWDWTESGLHSLAQGSKQVLSQIPEDQQVEIYAFFADPEEARGILDPYDYASDRLSYKIFDANKSPLLAQRLEVGADRVLVVCAGPCETSVATVKTTELTEQKLTEAIRSVVSKPRKVYFVIGHDESEPASEADNGLSVIASALGSENIKYDTLLLAQADKIPDDADAVAIVGPSFSFFEREINALDGYLKKGGSVLLLTDALQDAKLAEPLRKWSIELGSDLIVDQQLQLLGPPLLTLEAVAADYGVHPVNKDMKGLTVFRLARSVAPVDGSEGEVTTLIRTGSDSWAVSDKGVGVGDEVKLDPDKDRKGPIPLAVARTFKTDDVPEEPPVEGHPPIAAKPGREGRLVVVGDADFAQNRSVLEGKNQDLFLNMVAWLVGEENFITVDRKLPRASRVQMTEANMKLFSYLGLFLVPEGVLLLGIWNWWRRRQA
jgi:ABC-type uncharacterized transport system involved in gliding motility auxiliary subunit